MNHSLNPRFLLLSFATAVITAFTLMSGCAAGAPRKEAAGSAPSAETTVSDSSTLHGSDPAIEALRPLTPVNGPTVVFVHTDPATIEVNREIQPIQPPQVLAEIRDFQFPITQVLLQFTTLPLELPMIQVGDHTWRVELDSRQLRQLAISGRTIVYEAQVVARNSAGQESRSERKVEVAVRTPDLSTSPPSQKVDAS